MSDLTTYKEMASKTPETDMTIVAMAPWDGGFMVATRGQIFHLKDGELRPVKFREHVGVTQ